MSSSLGDGDTGFGTSVSRVESGVEGSASSVNARADGDAYSGETAPETMAENNCTSIASMVLAEVSGTGNQRGDTNNITRTTPCPTAETISALLRYEF